MHAVEHSRSTNAALTQMCQKRSHLPQCLSRILHAADVRHCLPAPHRVMYTLSCCERRIWKLRFANWFILGGIHHSTVGCGRVFLPPARRCSRSRKQVHDVVFCGLSYLSVVCDSMYDSQQLQQPQKTKNPSDSVADMYEQRSWVRLRPRTATGLEVITITATTQASNTLQAYIFSHCHCQL